jgi:hypothetical protein
MRKMRKYRNKVERSRMGNRCTRGKREEEQLKEGKG